MKVLFALYDKYDNFISCGFTLAEVGVKKSRSWFWQHTVQKVKLYRIPLEPQNDIFEEEDRKFIEEEGENVYTNKELAEMAGVSTREIYRRKAKRRVKQ